MELLRMTKGSLRLVDVSSTLPGLKVGRTLTSWRVMDKTGSWVDSFDDVPEIARNRIRPSMFSPTPEEAKGVNLERCLRILPHLQNTGGFFVAVIEKVARLPDNNPKRTSVKTVSTGSAESTGSASATASESVSKSIETDEGDEDVIIQGDEDVIPEIGEEEDVVETETVVESRNKNKQVC